MMPKLDGIQALQALRAKNVATPVLLLTAQADCLVDVLHKGTHQTHPSGIPHVLKGAVRSNGEALLRQFRRSYHMILSLPLRFLEKAPEHPVWLEVQLRTIAMDCWIPSSFGIMISSTMQS